MISKKTDIGRFNRGPDDSIIGDGVKIQNKQQE